MTNTPEIIFKRIELRTGIKMPDINNIDIHKSIKLAFKRIKTFKRTQREFKMISVPDNRRKPYLNKIKLILESEYEKELNKLNIIYNLLINSKSKINTY